MRSSSSVAARRRRAPRSTSTPLPLPLPLALALLLLARSPPRVADAHFLFARLDDEERHVRVYFSEPVAREGPVIGHIADRLPHMLLVGPNERWEEIALHPAVAAPGDDAGPPGYLWGQIPSGLDNEPYLVTGFLDYGEFGEGDGPKSDLQYTFSAQMASTSPSDDWQHFFHSAMGHDAVSPYFEDYFEGEDEDEDGDEKDDPFAVALKNYGPPYRAVVRGVGPSDPVRACLYDGDGSDQLVTCVTGTHNRTHHLTFDPDDVGLLKPCGSYFVLANATLGGRNAWSSSSAVWDGPCSPGLASRRSAPAGGQWFEAFRLGSFGPPAAGGDGGRGRGPPTALWAVALFVAGLVLGAAAFHIVTSRHGPSGGKHSRVESAEEDGAADFQDIQEAADFQDIKV